jgi:hypothetical protein
LFLLLFVAAASTRTAPSVPSIEPKFTLPLNPILEREQVTLDFKVQGHPEPRVIFLKNKHRLQPNESVDISKLKLGAGTRMRGWGYTS